MPATTSATEIGLKRLFVAAEAPSQVRDELATVREEFRRAGLRSVPADQLHLTLLFLGDIEACRITELEAALSRPAKAGLPLRLKVKGVGSCSYSGRTTLAWATVKDPLRDLEEVQENIARACRPYILRERESGPGAHLTLARAGRESCPNEDEVGRILSRWKRFLFTEWIAEELTLFATEPTDHGWRYERLATFRAQL